MLETSKKYEFELVEPIHNLLNEVRKIGKQLGLPSNLIENIHFLALDLLLEYLVKLTI